MILTSRHYVTAVSFVHVDFSTSEINPYGGEMNRIRNTVYVIVLPRGPGSSWLVCQDLPVMGAVSI